MLKGDVNNTESMAAALEAFKKATGSISGLVNNAGIHIEAPSEQQPVAEFEQVLRTNTTATLAVCQQAFHYLKDSGGCIVNIGSCFAQMRVKRNRSEESRVGEEGERTRKSGWWQ